jgi:preprotein translocase subunit SecY
MKPRRQLRLLSRYLPRRFLYTILYGAFILFLVFFYRKVAFELSRSPAYNVKNNGDAYDEAGEQIPAHRKRQFFK